MLCYNKTLMGYLRPIERKNYLLLKKDASDQKLNGRYFTPRMIAQYITDWVLDQHHIENVLEPSCGEGVFLDYLSKRRHAGDVNVVAIEIDDYFSKIAADHDDNSEWFSSWKQFSQYLSKAVKNGYYSSVVNDDFYVAYKEGLMNQRYQAILGNPPYIRYQYLTEEQREEQSHILVNNGMRSNKLINAWVSFTVACVSCMDADSRIGLVVPAELLQVKYSEDLRQYLVQQLNKLTIITFENLVFDGIEQEVVLLLGEKSSDSQTHQIRIVQCLDANSLPSENELRDIPFYNEDKDAVRKWTRYFLNPQQEELLHSIERDKRFIRFSQIAKIEVGITTGNNKYFCVNNDTVEKYKLAEYCRPLIARSVNIKGAVFTKEDWEYNIKNKARTYLLDLTPFTYSSLNEETKRYIKYGEDEEQNTTYKCSIRDEWYKVPSVWSPDAFFLRRNYLYPKFMLNSPDVKAVSTDTMHRVRFKSENIEKRALVAYYNSLALTYTEIEGRSYGGGVLEILPGEVSKIILPDVFSKDIVDDQIIDDIVEEIDVYIRNHDDIQGLLDITDKAILMDIMKLSQEDVHVLRDSWLTLRRRRLSRGGYEDNEEQD